jgi:protein-disulfide isomerase
LNIDRLRRDVSDPELMAIVNQDIADAKTLGVRKTPQFFVNGKPLMNFEYRPLKAMLDAEVAAQY